MEEIKLGNIASIQTGPFGSQLHQSDYKPKGVPCIMPFNISSNLNINCDKIAYISETDADRLSKHKTQIGDIVYSRRGDVEKCAFISERENGWICGTGCIKVSVTSPNVCPKFIAYQLSSPKVKRWIAGNAVGTTMLNLNTTVLSDCPIILPSILQQKYIADFLSALDSKIELNRRLNDNLTQFVA